MSRHTPPPLDSSPTPPWEAEAPSRPPAAREPHDVGRPFAELRDEGLLWLINTVVFHPRGFALALHFDNDKNATGWSLYGDGLEAWQFADDDVVDEMFAKTKKLLG